MGNVYVVVPPEEAAEALSASAAAAAAIRMTLSVSASRNGGVQSSMSMPTPPPSDLFTGAALLSRLQAKARREEGKDDCKNDGNNNKVALWTSRAAAERAAARQLALRHLERLVEGEEEASAVSTTEQQRQQQQPDSASSSSSSSSPSPSSSALSTFPSESLPRPPMVTLQRKHWLGRSAAELFAEEEARASASRIAALAASALAQGGARGQRKRGQEVVSSSSSPSSSFSEPVPTVARVPLGMAVAATGERPSWCELVPAALFAEKGRERERKEGEKHKGKSSRWSRSWSWSRSSSNSSSKRSNSDSDSEEDAYGLGRIFVHDKARGDDKEKANGSAPSSRSFSSSSPRPASPPSPPSTSQPPSSSSPSSSPVAFELPWLALSLPTASLYANPREMIDPADAARKLKKILPRLDEDVVRERLLSAKQFVYIARQITPREQLAINNLGIAGTYFENTEKRRYPLGRAAAQVIGYVMRLNGQLAPR